MKCDFSKLKSIAKWALHFKSSLLFFFFFFSIFRGPSAFYYPLPPTIWPGSQYLSPSPTENSKRATSYTSTISEETEEEEEQEQEWKHPKVGAILWYSVSVWKSGDFGGVEFSQVLDVCQSRHLAAWNWGVYLFSFTSITAEHSLLLSVMPSKPKLKLKPSTGCTGLDSEARSPFAYSWWCRTHVDVWTNTKTLAGKLAQIWPKKKNTSLMAASSNIRELRVNPSPLF